MHASLTGARSAFRSATPLFTLYRPLSLVALDVSIHLFVLSCHTVLVTSAIWHVHQYVLRSSKSSSSRLWYMCHTALCTILSGVILSMCPKVYRCMVYIIHEYIMFLMKWMQKPFHWIWHMWFILIVILSTGDPEGVDWFYSLRTIRLFDYYTLYSNIGTDRRVCMSASISDEMMYVCAWSIGI